MTAELLVIIFLAALWYGIVPVAGAFVERRIWRFFRRRFIELRKKPLLDYAGLVGGGQPEYKFYGVFESVSPNGILWMKSEGLTVRADLRKANIYVFPNAGAEGNVPVFDPEEVPEKIRWNRISSLTKKAKVFAGGALTERDNQRIFASLPDTPLFIIFYEGSENTLAMRAVRAGRHRNEFFNFLTPYAFILGAFSQILIAFTYLSRPAHRFTLIAALIALFTPLLPWIPPGMLFTTAYRRLWVHARAIRADRDLARFNGLTVRGYTRRAYILEVISWVLLLAGIVVNVFFITLVIPFIRF